MTAIDRFLENQRRTPTPQGDGNSNRGVYTGIVTHTEATDDPDNPNVFACVPEISQEFVFGPCRWVSHGRPPQTDDLCLLVITRNDAWVLEYADIESSGGGGPGDGDLHYVHTQGSPSATWTVEHNLGKYPSVSVVDTGDSVVIPDVAYIDANTVRLDFGSATSGKAFVN